MNNDILASSPVERGLRARHEKTDHIESFLRTLDGLIFLQVGILYLCDNLTFLLMLRAVSQVVHVQYRPPGTTQLTPVIFVNVVCFITHLLNANTSTKPLHGGLIVDFVGELASSRWRLLSFDLVISGLQMLMLVLGYEKQILSGEVQPQAEAPQQDIEAEEEGRLRPQRATGETTDGIELQSLSPESDEDRRPRKRKQREPPEEDDDVVVLDMKTSLGVLLRRPLPTTSPASPTMANVLARIAAARARPT
ncbi:hypothetical protein EDD36DRAFT_9287 [Exophiala viscosa]|uniref:DUF1746 domain-containing protein n=1 Tax=Exophiala viscosa TaxID=2486360 RepID=A0AAN6E5A5_9EURO|nr:hypothetical protein EDD36DRAFT_9287 [Exophiala viscosa]